MFEVQLVGQKDCWPHLLLRLRRIARGPYKALMRDFDVNTRREETFDPRLRQTKRGQNVNYAWRKELTSRNRKTEGVIPMLGFTLDAGRSISGGGWFGDFIAFAFFLFISGDCFPSGGELRVRHSFCHSCRGLAASRIRVRGMYSSWPVVTNSRSSIF